MIMLRFGFIAAISWTWQCGGLAVAQQKEPAKMNKLISVIVSSPQSSLLGGPVPAVVTVRNSGREQASILLPYPNPNHLSFECGARAFAEQKPLELTNERVAPTVIAAGGSYSASYFLNRYFHFLKAGEAEIRYHLQMVVNNQDATYDGSFLIRLVTGSEAELGAQLNQYASGLRGPNRLAKQEAAEALAYLDTPLVVPHLISMLMIDNLEVTAIESLSRHPSEATSLAIALSLSHPDSSVVQAALEAIDRLKIPIPRFAVQRLLSASNPNTQWLALGWLAKHPSTDDLPLLAPLVESSNAAVRERALTYRQALR